MAISTPVSSASVAELTEADVQALRSGFPAFAENPGTLFFDNAATTQKPAAVIEVMQRFYRNECANAGRGFHHRSSILAARIEETRVKLALFLGADPRDVCFTSGATDSLNKVALSWGLGNLKSGDEVLVCPQDHKSTVLPWYNLRNILKRFGVEIKIVPIRLHREGNYELKSIREALSERTKLIAMTHVHHLYGLDMEVSRVREIVGPDVLICLDASQSVGHRNVNVSQLNVNFLVFSGHKMFAANGVGVVWVSPHQRTSLMPVTVGGGMFPLGAVEDMQLPLASLADMLESGTQDIPGILSLQAAIEQVNAIGVERIESWVFKLVRHLYYELKQLPGIEFSPGVDRCGKRRSYGIVSFRFEQVDSADLAFALEGEGVVVRTGDHCLSTKQDDDFLRVSLHVYNTLEEVDRFIAILREQLL